MLNTLFFSAAGKRSNERITALFEKLANCDWIPREEKSLITQTIKVAAHGNYPDPSYYESFYERPDVIYKSIAELSNYTDECIDFYHQSYLRKQALAIVNDSNNSQEVIQGLSKLTQDNPTDTNFELPQPITFSKTLERPLTQGIMFGIPELDEVTNGGQPGTIASIAAFTGGGKSTLLNSVIFKNCLLGKKCVLLSLELAPDLVWLMMEARYMYQVKGIQVSSQDLLFHKMPSDVQEQVVAAEQDFLTEFACNLLIIDESPLSKKMLLDYKLFSSFIRQITDKWGTLDILGVDHVGQFELLYPECGNQIIKQLQSFSKTFEDADGKRPFIMLAVQANREGQKRASKRGGAYDLQAIADLNECMSANTQTRVTNGNRYLTAGQVVRKFAEGQTLYTNCVDYSTGQVVRTRVTDAFTCGSAVDWYELQGQGITAHSLFTPEHRVLVNGVKTALSDLPDRFMCDKVDWCIKGNAYQVLLGTLLGDSVLSKSDGSTRGTYCCRLMQGGAQLDYLNWKVSMLGSAFCSAPHQQGTRNVFVACTRTFVPAAELLSAKVVDRGYKGITYEILSTLEPLGLLTWYLDDGCFVQDSVNSFHVVFSCTNFGEAGAKLMCKVLLEKFGLHSYLSVLPDRRSNKPNIQIRLYAPDSRKFISLVSPLIDVPCVEYKFGGYSAPKRVAIPEPAYFGVVPCSVEVLKKKVIHHGKKYNFTVEHPDHNYILPGGLVSANCERSSSYCIFLYTSDESKIVQETKVTLIKHRLGGVITEPVTTSFYPDHITVGETVEQVTVSDDEFNSAMGDFDGFGGSFDDDF